MTAPIEPEEEDFVFGGLNLLNKSLRDLDERGLVLSLAAFAEESLGQLLAAFMLSTDATSQLLKGFNAPLGTFSSRIKAAYALGLIAKDQSEDLERLRKIRNEFAHSWRPITFGNPKIAPHIRALNYSSIDDKFPETPREKVHSSLTALLVELRSEANQINIKGAKAKLTGSRLLALFSGDIDRQIEEARNQVSALEENQKSATGERLVFIKMLHKRIEVKLSLLFGQVPEDRKLEVLALLTRIKSTGAE